MARPAGKTVVGLDIEPGYVVAVESRPGRIAVERAAAMAIAADVVRDGEVLDVATLAGGLRALFTENRLPRRVRLGLANQRIVMRTIDLPPLKDPKQLASAVRFQAQDHIPMPLDQAVLEYQSLGIVQTPEGERSRVVLVAARRDMVERLLQATTQAGLRAEGVDLSAFAMIRALYRPGVDDASGALYLNVGGMTNLAIALGTTCVFTRVVAAGSESMATELAERRGLTLEHSRAWLRHVGLLSAIEEIEGDRDIVAEAREVLVDSAGRIADEVRNSLDFHTMQGGVAVTRTIVTGPAVAIPGFAEQLGYGIGLPIELGLVPEHRAGALAGLDAGRLAVAAGLTVTEVPA
jgi:type IV pilus assembly protein PilM